MIGLYLDECADFFSPFWLKWEHEAVCLTIYDSDWWMIDALHAVGLLDYLAASNLVINADKTETHVTPQEVVAWLTAAGFTDLTDYRDDNALDEIVTAVKGLSKANLDILIDRLREQGYTLNRQSSTPAAFWDAPMSVDRPMSGTAR